MSNPIERIISRIKRADTPLFTGLKRIATALMHARVPVIRPVGAIIYGIRFVAPAVWWWLVKFFYLEPVFRYRADRVGRNLILDRGLPFMVGPGHIHIGDDVRISKNVNFLVGSKDRPDGNVIVGNRTFLGFMTTYSALRKIRIGSDVLIAAQVRIFDNNSHSLDPDIRTTVDTLGEDDIAPVVIGDKAWIGMFSIIMKGVTIGEGAVVAAGSIVTTDVPAFHLAAGNPARIIRPIDCRATRDQESAGNEGSETSSE